MKQRRETKISKKPTKTKKKKTATTKGNKPAPSKPHSHQKALEWLDNIHKLGDQDVFDDLVKAVESGDKATFQRILRGKGLTDEQIDRLWEWALLYYKPGAGIFCW